MSKFTFSFTELFNNDVWIIIIIIKTLGHFTVITREAGAGSLSLGVEGPSKAVIDFQDKKDGTSDVNYVCSEPGLYHSIYFQTLCNALLIILYYQQLWIDGHMTN